MKPTIPENPNDGEFGLPIEHRQITAAQGHSAASGPKQGDTDAPAPAVSLPSPPPGIVLMGVDEYLGRSKSVPAVTLPEYPSVRRMVLDSGLRVVPEVDYDALHRVAEVAVRENESLRGKQLVSLTIIPWEPGQLGVSFKYRNGQQSAASYPYLPNCRTTEHLAAERQLAELRKVSIAFMERVLEAAKQDSRASYADKLLMREIEQSLAAAKEGKK